MYGAAGATKNKTLIKDARTVAVKIEKGRVVDGDDQR